MNINNLKNLFYSATAGCVCNFFSGLATLYVILFWFPKDILKETELQWLFMLIGVPIFIGIFSVFVYNLIRFRLVKSGELNYGMFGYTLSTLPFILPMIMYRLAWLRGFRVK